MEISNRALTGLIVLTSGLVVAAVALTITTSRPRHPHLVPAEGKRVDVMPVVKREGGIQLDTKGPLRVRVDKGTDATSAILDCSVFKSERPVIRGSVVFPSVPRGRCSLQLKGTESAYSPVFPDDQITCLDVAGATECTGGKMSEHAARVAVDSELPGTLSVDGDPFGPLPLEGLRMRPGTRQLQVVLSEDVVLEWSLVVQPEERIQVFFPAPEGVVLPEPASAPAAAEQSG